MEPSFGYSKSACKRSGKLRGCVALITGADNGIGRAIAVAYAREGANIAFTYQKGYTDAAVTADMIRDSRTSMMALKMDQTKRHACEDVIRQVVETFGHIDILVNNTAYQQTYSALEELADDELERISNTNIADTVEFCRAALKHLPPGGSIINTTSIEAVKPGNSLAPYAAAKATLANFTATLAKEALGRGVKVTGVTPYLAKKPLIPSAFPTGHVPHFGANTLFDRTAQPAEVAPIFVLLAYRAASFFTGEIYDMTRDQFRKSLTLSRNIARRFQTKL